MATFQYRAYGARGDLAEGRIDAVSRDAASDLLWAQGLTPFEMRVVDRFAKSWWKRDLIARGGPTQADLASFTREFATLNAAEIPLDNALRIVAEQQTTPSMQKVVAEILADVLNGGSLSDAMQKHPRVFPLDYLSVVRAGEIGGTLGQVFEELADLLDRRMEIRARTQSSLIYPVVLVVLTLVSLAIIVGSLIPSIAPIFAESGKPMPVSMSVVVALRARWMEAATLVILLAGGSTAAAALALRQAGTRLAFDRFKLTIPSFGPLILHRETGRFARTLGTLLKAGVPLLQAAASARSVVGNGHVAAGIDRAIESIREGAALHHALRNEAILPSLALRMISVGEESGKLDRMLVRVAVIFEQRTQRNMERFMTMLTPFLTGIIAVLIGGLVMTVMNAIVGINDLAFQ